MEQIFVSELVWGELYYKMKEQNINKKAAFLDRDGTINVDYGYIGDPNKFDMYPDVAKGIRLLKENGFLIIVVSNQSGIARGYFDVDAVEEVNQKVVEVLRGGGLELYDVYYCPHHPEGVVEEYKRQCDCRKPNIGMLEDAAGRFDLDLRDCYMVGDQTTDIQTGINAGCQTVLIDRELKQNKVDDGMKVDFIAGNLIEAAEWIVKNEEKLS